MLHPHPPFSTVPSTSRSYLYHVPRPQARAGWHPRHTTPPMVTSVAQQLRHMLWLPRSERVDIFPRAADRIHTPLVFSSTIPSQSAGRALYTAPHRHTSPFCSLSSTTEPSDVKRGLPPRHNGSKFFLHWSIPYYSDLPGRVARAPWMFATSALSSHGTVDPWWAHGGLVVEVHVGLWWQTDAQVPCGSSNFCIPMLDMSMSCHTGCIVACAWD